MSKKWLVFERGSGKWVAIIDSVVRYTSSRSFATLFSETEIAQLAETSKEFAVFKNTMRVLRNTESILNTDGQALENFLLNGY